MSRRHPSASVAGILLLATLLAPVRGAQPAAPDEAALRARVQQFFAVYAREDLDGFMALWSAASPERSEWHEKARQHFARFEQIRVRDLLIRQVVPDAERFQVRISCELQGVETATGRLPFGYGKVQRTLVFAREREEWRVWRYFPTARLLAERLLAAAGEPERETLLAQEAELFTTELCDSLGYISNTRIAAGDLQGAATACRYAQRIADRIGDRASHGRSLQNLALIDDLGGDWEKALEGYRASLLIHEEVRNLPGIARTAGNLSALYGDREEFDRAIPYAEQALALFRKLGDHESVATALLNLAMLYRSQGDLVQALHLMQRSLDQQRQRGDRPGEADVLSHLGGLQRAAGNFAEAEAAHQMALAICEGLADRRAAARLLHHLAHDELDQGNLADSSRLLEASARAYDALGPSVEMDALRLRAELAASNRDYRTALAATRETLARYERTGRPTDSVRALTAIGGYLRALGDLEGSAGAYRRALELSRALPPLSQLAALLGLGQTRSAQGNVTEALAVYDDTIRLVEEIRARLALAEESHDEFLDQRLTPYRLAAELLIVQGRSDEALEYAERMRGRRLLNALSHDRLAIARSMTAAEIEEDRARNAALAAVNTHLLRETQKATPDTARLTDLSERLRLARLDYQAFRTRLYARHPEMRTYRGEVRPVTLAETAALLPDTRTALLSFLVLGERTYLFVVTRAAGTTSASRPVLETHTIAAGATELQRRVAALLRQVADPNRGYADLARSLYDLLLRPAERRLAGKEHLIVAPDGPLWSLPFEVLQPGTNRSLIQLASLAYVPSFTVLREMVALRQRHDGATRGAAAPRAPTLLALGNPDIPGAAAAVRSARRGVRLRPLPAAEQEVRALAELYGRERSAIYVGAGATEARFKTEAGRASVVHLAAHCVLDDQSPLFSRIVLAQPPGTTSEDGLLEARELLRLNLPADLAVLAGCQTAGGSVRPGEGLIGLTWAFFVAGCPTVVASHWPVESKSTSRLMLAFHRELLRTQGSRFRPKLNSNSNSNSPNPQSAIRNPQSAIRNGKSAALRRAQLQLLRDPQYRHAYYWAGFSLFGDGR